MFRKLDTRTARRLADVCLRGRLSAIKAASRGLPLRAHRFECKTAQMAAVSMAEMVGVRS